MSNHLTYRGLTDSANLSNGVDNAIGQTIRERRKALRLTQEQLAERSGLRRAHIAMIETGSIAAPEVATLTALANALGMPLQELLNGPSAHSDLSPGNVIRDGPPAPEPSRDGIVLTTGMRIVDANPQNVGKRIEAYVAAGHGGWDDATGNEVVMLPEYLLGPGDYIVQAVGESMIDEDINDGDLLIVERRPNKIATHGDLVIAWLNDGLVIKRWYRRGGKKFLESANEEMGWKPREITDADVFEIQGVVKHIVKRPEKKTRGARDRVARATGVDLPRSKQHVDTSDNEGGSSR
jgi:SOS-response transcriptional repressor LexA